MPDFPRIIDCDRHVIEPIDLWPRYLPAEFRDHAPYFAYHDRGEPLTERVTFTAADGRLLPLPPDLMIDGEPVTRGMSARARRVMAATALERNAELVAAQHPQGQLDAMDRDGIEQAFLLPTFAGWLVSIDPMAAALSVALARAYNDWLRDFCAAEPGRLHGVGLLSRHDPEAMPAELERVAGFGWRAVSLRPNPVQGRTLSHPDYEPFWTACERLDMRVLLHEGTHTRLPTVGADRFSTHFAQHACSHPMEQMLALLALIEGGVLERHPGLRVAFLEAGCGWLPYWLWRLDTMEYGQVGAEVAEHVRRPPSEYFRRQCMVAVELDEPNLPEAIRCIGEDNVLFGSDFPHFDHDAAIAGEVAKLSRQLPEPVLRKLLRDNPAAFFGL